MRSLIPNRHSSAFVFSWIRIYRSCRRVCEPIAASRPCVSERADCQPILWRWSVSFSWRATKSAILQHRHGLYCIGWHLHSFESDAGDEHCICYLLGHRWSARYEYIYSNDPRRFMILQVVSSFEIVWIWDWWTLGRTWKPSECIPCRSTESFTHWLSKVLYQIVVSRHQSLICSR